MKKFRSIIKSDNGVAGVITAVLLVGLFISIIAFIQYSYVPMWMEQKESEHMGDLANQFIQLKYSIDTLSVNSRPNSRISVPIKLGSEEMPFFDSIRSYGSSPVLAASS